MLPDVVAKSMPAPPWPVTIMTLKKRILSCRCRKLNPVGVGWENRVTLCWIVDLIRMVFAVVEEADSVLIDEART